MTSFRKKKRQQNNNDDVFVSQGEDQEQIRNGPEVKDFNLLFYCCCCCLYQVPHPAAVPVPVGKEGTRHAVD